ncbi:MAG TPA: ABC transporter ATP-binding protein, partial [bacterium]|nr:ABC transporter ATP-binding protein [bacterium]
MAHPLYVWLRKRIRLDIFNITCGDSHLGQLLKDLLRQYKYTVGFIIALNCVAAMFEGSTMGALLLALDVLLGEKTTDTQVSFMLFQNFMVAMEERFGRGGIFAVYVGLAVASQLLRSGFQFLGRAATAYLQAWCEQDLRSRVFRQFFSVRYDHVVKYKIGDMALYTHQTNGMVSYLGYLNMLVSDLLILLTYISVLLWISWPITLFAVVTLGLLSFGLSRVIRLVRNAATQFVKATIRMNEQIVEYLQGIRTVRAFAQEEHVQELVDDTLREAMLANRRSLVWEATILPLVECLTVICVAALLVSCYALLDVNQQWLPRLAVYVFVIYRLMPRAGTINGNLASLKKLYPTVSRISAILREDNKPYMRDGGKSFEALRHGIEFRDVSFLYDGTNTPAVKDISFSIPRGTMTAIVGESGAGKSTLLDLVLRLYDPTNGVILADGVPLPEYDQKAWRNSIGMVNQDIHIFNATIHQNIAFRRPDSSRQETEHAARI